ncbi:hypothetical protein [Megasphaera sueciensis]|uniref:hypothetical protein n=1 Tax=Megasphaera sueciensis TaxID=349094 RepID=UPI003D02AA70
MSKKVKRENYLLANCRECGSVPSVVKSKITKQYSAYQVKCPQCGVHTKLCSTAECAVKCWNMGSGITGGNNHGTDE